MSKAERVERVKREIEAHESALREKLTYIEEFTKQVAGHRAALKDLQNQLKNLTPKQLKITDHVVLRYAERKYGFDIEAVRSEIEAKFENINELPDANIRGFIVKNNTIVTYVPKSFDYAEAIA